MSDLNRYPMRTTKMNPVRPTSKPILGFVARTPLVMSGGHKPIEELRPGDFLQSRPTAEGHPDDNQGGHKHEGPEPPRWWEGN
jgi:hypothetical protein